jgi:hypothetical protein
MGNITAASLNTFKSAEFIYARIKREFKSFDAVNTLDDTEFPSYTADILSDLGQAALKEEVAVICVKDGKAKLPNGFKRLHSAYKCHNRSTTHSTRQLQIDSVFEYDLATTCYTENNCEMVCEGDNKVTKLTIRPYVNEDVQFTYNSISPLRLTPNAKKYCVDNCENIFQTCSDEITINNGYIFTNFNDGDIFMQYYAMVVDENNIPMIPDVRAVEKAVEWYIKWRLLLNFWLVDDVANVQNKWSKAEQLYNSAFAEAKYINKLPAFSTMLNSLRNTRNISKTAFFSRNHNNN